MMRFLVINTCGNNGVAALTTEAEVIAEEALPGRGTSEALMPAVRHLFAESGWTLAELDAIGVVHGPGSFTGVRVGLSAAKGLCEALGVPLVAMSRLALLASSVPAAQAVALLDAGRGEFFCGVYKGGECISERLVSGAEARSAIAASSGIACEPRVAEQLGIALTPEPPAETMRAMMLARVEQSQWSDIASIDANYLRRTDAELLQERA
jgi:tRNA threonylcarbamoyladenosine biosynthesis protein TsaB